ncbi:unnamed protein product [Blumeria hordei]|uniref:C2H2-type domain-containing protein n=1 Tax=Blumeria hordei TaxID=2867405 RepID=A0A383V328_BLUHO|nr:unnamed protein product [Blumeria hordei]
MVAPLASAACLHSPAIRSIYPIFNSIHILLFSTIMVISQLQQQQHQSAYPDSINIYPDTVDYRMNPTIPYVMAPCATQPTFKTTTSLIPTSTPNVPSKSEAKPKSKSRATSKVKSCKTNDSGLRCEGSGKKRFVCNFIDCGKSFSRSEHLHRHALNHKEGDHTCERCLAHFRRRDLLDRHIARHKGKDDEAGGVGLGVLATRKRLWRNSDGKIVNSRRPSFAQGAMKRQQNSCTEKVEEATIKPEIIEPTKSVASSISPVAEFRTPISPLEIDSNVMGMFAERKHDESQPDSSWLDMAALPSPPISEIDSAELRRRDASLDHLDTLYDDPWQLMPQSTLPDIITHSPAMTRHPEYLTSPLWGAQPFQAYMGAFNDVPSDEILRLDNGPCEWQAWNQHLFVSKCRDDKRETLGDNKREWMINLATGHDGILRRSHGMNIN